MLHILIASVESTVGYLHVISFTCFRILFDEVDWQHPVFETCVDFICYLQFDSEVQNFVMLFVTDEGYLCQMPYFNWK